MVAVDLGASSGRVYRAAIDADHLQLTEVGRFANGAVRVAATLHWDILGLYRGILDGIAAAASAGPVASVGVDSWAVDYGLVSVDDSLLGNPVHHRDPRPAAAYEDIVGRVGAAEIWRRTGIALQPFNTLYQLATDSTAGHLCGVARVLLVPDLVAWMLTGQAVVEATNASTTQLVGVDGDWDHGLLAEAGVSAAHWGPMIGPGERIGTLRRGVVDDLGIGAPLPVTAVASHDTASAVVAVPAVSERFAYLSCGTWSLVGVELDAPILSEEARLAGFTNERGIDGTVRFHRNVMGLWLLQECVRTWERRGIRVELDALLHEAADLPSLRSVVDPDHASFLPPGDMPRRIADACRHNRQAVPSSPAEITRCIVDSLAVAYRQAVHSAQRLSGRTVDVIHLVGGGVHNALLCQVTADACGLPLVAGPVEAAALGNAIIQARALHHLDGHRRDLRHLVARHVKLDRYEPTSRLTARYAAAARSSPPVTSTTGATPARSPPSGSGPSSS